MCPVVRATRWIEDALPASKQCTSCKKAPNAARVMLHGRLIPVRSLLGFRMPHVLLTVPRPCPPPARSTTPPPASSASAAATSSLWGGECCAAWAGPCVLGHVQPAQKGCLPTASAPTCAHAAGSTHSCTSHTCPLVPTICSGVIKAADPAAAAAEYRQAGWQAYEAALQA